VRDVTPFGLFRHRRQRQLDHAQKIVSSQAIFVENFQDELVLFRNYSEDKLLVPMGVQGPLLGLGQDRVLDFVAVRVDQVDFDVRITGAKNVLLGQVVPGHDSKSEQLGALSAALWRRISIDPGLGHLL
jgi:hypothetical protein